MIRTAARNFRAVLGCFIGRPVLLVALIVFSASSARAADAGSARNLLAHGTEQQLWCADVIPPPAGSDAAARTVIRFRTAGDPQWAVLGAIAAPAVGLDNTGSELLVLLADGEWRIVADDGDIRSGIPLPDRAAILALTGDGEEVWAIAAAASGTMLDQTPPAATTTSPAGELSAGDVQHPSAATLSPTSAPAATQSAILGVTPVTATSRSTLTPAMTESASSSGAATTQSTSTTGAPPNGPSPVASSAGAPAAGQSPLPPHDLALLHLVRGQWTEVGLLPAGLRRADVVAASLDVFERRLSLAIATRDRAIRIYTRSTAGWSEGRDVATLPADGRLTLMEFEGRPILWVSDSRGPGSICVGGASWGKPIKLADSPALARFDRTALTAAMGRLILLASDGKDRLAEQSYNLDGTPAGAQTQALTAPVPLDTRVAQAMQLVVMAVLLVWVVGAMRQRPNLQQAVEHMDELGLAPLGKRFVGGMIDAVPLFVGLFIAGELARSGTQPLTSRLTLASPEVAAFTAGIGLYLLHTTVLELILARSIGKLLTGTRVAALDGTRPTAGAILVRNLLRIIDLFLIFPPVFVMFSPLRQRIGDMAGGTIVVLKSAAPLPKEPGREEPG